MKMKMKMKTGGKTGAKSNPNNPAKAAPVSYKSGGTTVKKGSPENKAGRGLMGSAKKGGATAKAMYGKTMMKKGGIKK